MQEYKMRMPENTSAKKTFSWGAFVTGFICGLIFTVVTLGILGSFYAMNALGGNSFQKLFSRAGQAINEFQESQKKLTAYGEIVHVGTDTLTIESPREDGTEQLTFRFNAESVFVVLANDDASTELPINPGDLRAGDYVTIITKERIGSVQDQLVVKALKF
jgi:hypothetical protein